MLPDHIAVTVKVTTILEKLDVSYFIGGSLASTIHGMVRTTQDSDLVTALKPEHVQSLVQALQKEFYVDEVMIEDAVVHQGSFNIIHRESMFKVDIFIPLQRSFEKSQFARAIRQVLIAEPRVEALVASAEDILLAKLEWYRLGGEVSERQWRDVLGVLKIQAENLDLDYMFHFAKLLKIEDLLEHALIETTT
ncbi:MAG: hypothetical protein MUO76_07145 [Anaerolineaceae bacterium]|nr:hypothetical protein [Anaerolineaceae bacterium]